MSAEWAATHLPADALTLEPDGFSVLRAFDVRRASTILEDPTLTDLGQLDEIAGANATRPVYLVVTHNDLAKTEAFHGYPPSFGTGYHDRIVATGRFTTEFRNGTGGVYRLLPRTAAP